MSVCRFCDALATGLGLCARHRGVRFQVEEAIGFVERGVVVGSRLAVLLEVGSVAGLRAALVRQSRRFPELVGVVERVDWGR